MPPALFALVILEIGSHFLPRLVCTTIILFKVYHHCWDNRYVPSPLPCTFFLFSWGLIKLFSPWAGLEPRASRSRYDYTMSEPPVPGNHYLLRQVQILFYPLVLFLCQLGASIILFTPHIAIEPLMCSLKKWGSMEIRWEGIISVRPLP
jgi:hypothetical protein